ncbi:MAG: nickel-dependent hydrogenase large subunit [Bilophila wadsworthia]
MAPGARGVASPGPRGALGHWTVIKNKGGRLPVCRPTTWNAAPRSGAASSARMRPPCSARRWMCPSSR